MQTKDEYIEGNHLQLDLWGDRFAALEGKIEEALSTGHDPLARRLKLLTRKKDTLKRRLREAAHGGPQTDWDSVRGEFEAAVSQFQSLASEVVFEETGA